MLARPSSGGPMQSRSPCVILSFKVNAGIKKDCGLFRHSPAAGEGQRSVQLDIAITTDVSATALKRIDGICTGTIVRQEDSGRSLVFTYLDLGATGAERIPTCGASAPPYTAAKWMGLGSIGARHVEIGPCLNERPNHLAADMCQGCLSAILPSGSRTERPAS